FRQSSFRIDVRSLQDLDGTIISAAGLLLHEWVHANDPTPASHQAERNAFWPQHLFVHAWWARRNYLVRSRWAYIDPAALRRYWDRAVVLDMILREWRPEHIGPAEYVIPKSYDDYYGTNEADGTSAPARAGTSSAADPVADGIEELVFLADWI